MVDPARATPVAQPIHQWKNLSWGGTVNVPPPSSYCSRMKNKNGSSNKNRIGKTTLVSTINHHPSTNLSRNANERLLKIHQLIAEQRFPNTFSLARDLEISRKTLKRDIQWMRDHWDLPIAFNRTRALRVSALNPFPIRVNSCLFVVRPTSFHRKLGFISGLALVNNFPKNLRVYPQFCPPDRFMVAPMETTIAEAKECSNLSNGDPQPQPENIQANLRPSSHRRTGMVARLPKEIRDQISEMLLDGLPYLQIIERIGEPGKCLVVDHIRSWKDGGYEDWLVELERKEALCATREAALDLVKEKAGATVQDAGRAIAAAQLYELLLSFDPRAFAEALAKKPELYFRLINSLARLSEGESICQRHARDSKSAPPEPGQSANVIAAETLKEIARHIKLL